MPYPLAAILFDLDGTLVDTAPDFVQPINQLRAQGGLPALTELAIRNQVSNGAKALVQLALSLSEDHPEFTQARSELLELYYQTIGKKAQLFPGISKLLDTLEQKSIPWGVVTNKPWYLTERLLENMALSSRTSVTICPEHVKNTKPDPEPLLLACHKLKVDPYHVVYVGDHQRDISAGNSAGMLTVAASYGYVTADHDIAQWQADHAISSADLLLAWLEELNWQRTQEP
ncbi:HAD-IA family hydrolase [Spartinivicinus poritis]|uniref:HAD-IA family hydrolase n=1 Tax=Spartinivicinus poritis TaxID=2994640 RepID=A0ABT5U7F4_9GAMM|nr:HAD-IA family hydrolase [Spartinivicinus sp. A2-2]MDE1462304.1 HAD-IA family hydrolase [Spartinivicinus sp. A2-2]